MPSTEQLPSGNFRGLYRDADGRKRRVPGTFRRKSDARDAASEAETKARRHAVVDHGFASAKMTFGEWWGIAQPDREFAHSDTANTESNVIGAHVLPKWRDVPLNRIKRKDVQRWVDHDLKVTKGRSAAYVHRIYSLFATVINTAVTEEVLDASPCANIKLPKIPKKAKPYVSTEYASALRERLPEQYRRLLDFGLQCGLRPGELCGLHAHRVDLARGLIEVTDVYVSGRHVIRPSPKDADTRFVPLTDSARAIVATCLDGRDLAEGCGVPHLDGDPCPSAAVFTTPRGSYLMRPNTINKALRRAAEEAGMPHQTSYAIRRGFATRAAHGGMDAFTLGDILGHGDVRLTRGYVQQAPTARAKLAAALDEYPELSSVHGEHGTAWDKHGTAWDEHGTNLNNQGFPDTPSGVDENTG